MRDVHQRFETARKLLRAGRFDSPIRRERTEHACLSLRERHRRGFTYRDARRFWCQRRVVHLSDRDHRRGDLGHARHERRRIDPRGQQQGHTRAHWPVLGSRLDPLLFRLHVRASGDTTTFNQGLTTRGSFSDGTSQIVSAFGTVVVELQRGDHRDHRGHLGSGRDDRASLKNFPPSPRATIRDGFRVASGCPTAA